MTLTSEEFVKRGGGQCPVCGSTSYRVSIDEGGFVSGDLYMFPECNKCGAEWAEKYALVSMNVTYNPQDEDGESEKVLLSYWENDLKVI
jgi:ssDNA-binding Zn-finger/Zn-ribbon topoisomerase 1